jgi:nicotinamidase-related amidase
VSDATAGGTRLLDVDDSVLCVVDVQPGFLRKLGSGADEADVVARIAWLIAVGARLDVPAIVTEEEPERNGATMREVLERLADGASRFTKPVFGLADVPEIIAAVEETGRHTAVLVGLETDVCVSHSALGLLGRGYRVAVVRDATASPGDAHGSGLDRMRDAGAVVLTAKSLYYEWIRTVERASAVEGAMTDVPLPPGLVL